MIGILLSLIEPISTKVSTYLNGIGRIDKEERTFVKHYNIFHYIPYSRDRCWMDLYMSTPPPPPPPPQPPLPQQSSQLPNTTVGKLVKRRGRKPGLHSTAVQRNAANARERCRMRTLSEAFMNLKKVLPWVPKDTKLSKLVTLQLASRYIAYLMRLLEDPTTPSPAFNDPLFSTMLRGSTSRGAAAPQEPQRNAPQLECSCQEALPPQQYVSLHTIL